MFYSNVDKNIPHMVFIGRWCPLHKGHTWIIEQKMIEHPDKPVLILVRTTSFDKYPVQTRAYLVRAWMKHSNIKGSIMIIPDIEGVYYGRGVGYNVDELEPPKDIEGISATDIRNRIANGDDSWKDIVAPGTSEILESMICETE